MSVNLSKGPVWAVAVVVGLIVATALVAGYVDRPGTGAQVAAVSQGDCASCPVQGDCANCPAQCCKADGACPADAAAATCPAGAAVMAQTADEAGSSCPMKAAAAGQCGGGQCPASK